MTLEEFYQSVTQEVNVTYNEQFSNPSNSYKYKEYVFLDIIISFLTSYNMIGDNYHDSYCDTTYGKAKIKLHSYAISDDSDRLDLIICHYTESDSIENLIDSDITKKFVNPSLRFLEKSINDNNKFLSLLEKSSDAYMFAEALPQLYNDITDIKILIITNAKTKTKFFQEKKIASKYVKIEVFDIERYHKLSDEGKPQDELIVDFVEAYQTGIPCVYVPKTSSDEYGYALTAIPGEILYQLYGKYRDRILEANVRSFLSTRGKRNKGIQETLRDEPSRFMAYNNGLVLLTEDLVVRSDDDGASFIEQMRGFQIVNGGQTTATIFFTKRDSSNQIDLNQVRVPAKIIVTGEDDNPEIREEFVGKVARFANTQNPIKESDFLAHSPFHRNFEKISQSIFCPDSVGRWFYERANGSYNTYLLREGQTPAKRRHITTEVTPRKRVIKKTELGQSIACWEGYPHIASLGGEKCLVSMKEHLEKDADSINVDYVKRRIAEYLIYYHTFYCLRGDICKQSPGVVRNYLVAILSLQFRESINFDRIWLNQDLSDSFKTQIRVWGQYLYDAMIERSGGRQLSESGKRPQTWDYFQTCSLEPIRTKISEFRV